MIGMKHPTRVLSAFGLSNFCSAFISQVTNTKLMEILRSYNLLEESVRIKATFVGFDPTNRDGCGVVPAEVQDRRCETSTGCVFPRVRAYDRVYVPRFRFAF